MSINFQPPRTVERFMFDNSLVRCIVGPIGSGKSMGCIMELVRRCQQQAPDHNGVRFTRWAIVRNTLQQLRQTVLADVVNYLGPMVRFYVTDATIQLRVPLDDGTFMHSDWLLIPLDTPQDVKRLLSMQLTGAWINEIREVPIGVVAALIGRLGRFPSKINGGPTWFGLVADTNPWDTDSPYHDRFVLNPDAKWKLFHQPSGIAPDAENVENLPDGYYGNLMSNRDEDWVAVHVESQWGTSNAGQAVFRRSFHVPTHVRDMQVVINPARPIMVAMDFGRTPAALIGQTDTFGRALIFDEVVTTDMGLYAMVGDILKPKLQRDYSIHRMFIVGDPAGGQKSQLSEETAFKVLEKCGFKAYPASTNSIDPRLRTVERLMRSTIMGEPALQIRRAGCPTLIHALGNKYRYRKKRDGQLEDLPEKLHPWSDIADCLQYFALGMDQNLAAKHIARGTPSKFREPPNKAGWT